MSLVMNMHSMIVKAVDHTNWRCVASSLDRMLGKTVQRKKTHILAHSLNYKPSQYYPGRLQKGKHVKEINPTNLESGHLGIRESRNLKIHESGNLESPKQQKPKLSKWKFILRKISAKSWSVGTNTLFDNSFRGPEKCTHCWFLADFPRRLPTRPGI